MRAQVSDPIYGLVCSEFFQSQPICGESLEFIKVPQPIWGEVTFPNTRTSEAISLQRDLGANMEETVMKSQSLYRGGEIGIFPGSRTLEKAWNSSKSRSLYRKGVGIFPNPRAYMGWSSKFLQVPWSIWGKSLRRGRVWIFLSPIAYMRWGSEFSKSHSLHGRKPGIYLSLRAHTGSSWSIISANFSHIPSYFRYIPPYFSYIPSYFLHITHIFLHIFDIFI